MLKFIIAFTAVTSLTLTSFAQNPAGPRGGTEPPLTNPPKTTLPPKVKATPTLPSADQGNDHSLPTAAPTSPTPTAGDEASKNVVTPESHKNAPHRFGVFAGLNLPHVFTYGLDYKHSSESWGLSLGAGSFGLKIDEVSAKMKNQEIVARYFPWQGAFFAGLGYGKHEIKASKEETVQGQSVTIEAKVKADYLVPQVGWHWATSWGLTFGFEVGILASMGSTAEIDPGTTNPVVINDPEYQSMKKDAEDLAENLGNKTLPYLTLLRLGYQF